MKRRLKKGDIIAVKDCSWARKHGHVGHVGEVMGAYCGTWRVRFAKRTLPHNYYRNELEWLGSTV